MFSYRLRASQLVLRPNEVIRIETLVVYIYCRKEFLIVILFVDSSAKPLLAIWTSQVVYKPFLNTLTMEDMVTVEHAAL